ncbi:MAG: sigma-70 family RNA polymerase sigma factor [Pseudomonadota bacterium]
MAGFRDTTLNPDTARALTRGDPDAQAEVYGILAPPVLGLALRILGDRAQAEEVLQDTFLSLLEGASSIRESAALVGWVRQTAVNHCLMRLRSPWQQRRSSEPAMEHIDPAQSAEREATLTELERALGQLKADTRMVLWLHDVEGYTHREIGEVFGRSESFSKSQLARGYRQLLNNRRLNAQGLLAADHRQQAAGENPEKQGAKTDDGLAAATHIDPACAS